MCYNLRMREILIADDERAIRNGLKDLLEGEGYAVRLARDGDEALALIEQRRPDLLLLDVMMPRKNGFRTCAEVRRKDASLPVVFLTALEGEADEIRAMGLGADDYISKTASSSLLLAHINRAMDRIGPENADTDVIRLGVVTVDATNGDVSWKGHAEKLTESELDLLKLLHTNRNQFLDKDAIVTCLRGNGFSCVDSMIYSHIHNLRRKLGPAGSCVACDRSFGYRLRV